MKILLTNPINRSYVVMPSLGLGYLAAVLREEGHEVSILDCIKERMSYEDFAVYILREQFDVIGFQVFSYDLTTVKKHLSLVRRHSPGTVTIAGGPHPSGDPRGTMSLLDDLDFAFRGEAEIGLPMLLQRLSRREDDYATIPGLVWRDMGTISMNPQAVVQDLDSLPMPAWDLLQPETYPEAPHGAFTREFPTAPIITTRGCPSRCTFCAGHKINGRQIRWRSVENVVMELRYLAGRGIREFHIEDENFTASREFVMQLCDRLVSERLGLSWSLPSGIRLDKIDREMIAAMAKAGCYSLAVGIEFGTDRMLRLTRKGISVDMIREQVKLFKGSGIKVTGFFMFGIPGEKLEEMEQTVRLALELPLDRAQFNNFMPLPGSIEWEKLLHADRLRDIDWDHFFVHDVAYVDDSLTASDLKRVQRSAVFRFYLRPRIIAGLLGEIRSFRHLHYLLKRLLDTLR
jgi:radical SAM superfamily enzyme YgiQ (UPF0313 family)